ncbi:MAG TPA: trigger factor [Bacteroidaceae bacterium]|jgi:trigger factor|nr:trigger factor [Bacteroidaceae bacterium]OPZ48785.1 MAG: Trigger factor [Bacteroidetes bacterium ADurb.BinA104]HOD67838.1 trigger factor [Bacteroidaceae bacterium]HQL25375.1 trigger factor [Bacteroidaceae bacterium]
MNVTFENVSKVQGLLTVSIEKADYQENVTKALKETKKKVQMPGFRPGMVPMSLVQKIYGKAIKADEINKIIQEKVYNYIKENKIDMLGEPLPNDAKESGMSLDDDDMKFYFDIALAPEFEVSVDKEDSITYYEIKVSDEMVENRIKDYTRQFGRYEQVDGYADNDMIKGRIVELEADGSVKEGGIEADSVTIMPTYFKEESQKKLFKGAVKGGTVVFSPSKAYNGSEVEISSLLKIKKEEVAGNISDFSLEIESITRFIEADLNQELFDGVFGKDTVKDIDDFRSKVREMIAAGFVPDSDYRFMLDSRTYFMEKVGKLDFADDLLKRIIKANRKEDEQDSVDTDFGRSLEELKWHLIKEKLVEKYAVKVEEDDVKAMAREATRAQFAQYGMMNLPDELLDNYSKDMLKKRETVDGLVNRVVESKLTAALKKDVKLKKKKVSVEEFNKLFENPSVS